MIPRSQRLPYKEGLKLKENRRETPVFRVFSRKNNQEQSRFMVVVGLKTSKSSVIRHRTKRLVIHAFKSIFGDKGLDMVIITNPKTANQALSDLEKEAIKIKNELSI